MRTPSPPYCRLDLAPPLADQFIFGVAPIDYGPVLLLKPFGFHLTMNTLPSEGLLLRPTTSLPPSLDMAPLIRAPEGLQPSRTTRCSAHAIARSDFPFVEPSVNATFAELRGKIANKLLLIFFCMANEHSYVGHTIGEPLQHLNFC